MTLKEIQEKLKKYHVPETLMDFQKFYSGNFRMLRKMLHRNEVSDWCDFLNINPTMILTMNDSDIERRIITQYKCPAFKISRILEHYLELPDRQKRVHFNLKPQIVNETADKRLKGGASNLWEIFDFIKEEIANSRTVPKKKPKECSICPNDEPKKIKCKCKCQKIPEDTACGIGHFYKVMNATACPLKIRESIQKNYNSYHYPNDLNEKKLKKVNQDCYTAIKEIVSDTDTENDFDNEITMLNDCSKEAEEIPSLPSEECLNNMVNTLGLDDINFSSETETETDSSDEGNCCSISRKQYKNIPESKNSLCSNCTNSSGENCFVDSSEHSITSTENSYNNDSACGYNNPQIGCNDSMENVNDLYSDSSSDSCEDEDDDDNDDEDEESCNSSESSDSNEELDVNCVCKEAKNFFQEHRNKCPKEREPNFAYIQEISKELERPETPELRLPVNLYELHKCITDKPENEFCANECSIICKAFMNRSMKVPIFKKSRNVYDNEE